MQRESAQLANILLARWDKSMPSEPEDEEEETEYEPDSFPELDIEDDYVIDEDRLP